MSAVKSCGCGGGALTCGCCAGSQPLTPMPTANRPGLQALSYRVGTHGSFLETMKARLSRHELPGGVGFDGGIALPTRPLAALSTRDGSDAAIALLDAWAVVGDVLTFYQERVANEGYLRTATEMRSVYEMARLVGYRPRPGVAASTYLAYTIDSNTKEEVLIPKGSRSQSVPGPGEFPQTFETSEDLKARALWNDLKLRLTQPQRFEGVRQTSRVYLQGINTGLTPGDPLMFSVAKAKHAMRRVTEVLPDRAHDRTLVKTASWVQQQVPPSRLSAGVGLALLRSVLDRAPIGAVAKRIVEGIHSVEALATADDTLPPVLVRSADEAIAAELAAVSLPAQNLRAWASEVRDALQSLARPAVAPVTATYSAAAEDIPVAALLSRLTRLGSQPRTNAVELPRSLAADFGPTSDAGLKVLGAVAPAIKETLAPALAGQTDSNSAQTFEVHAFRVRAGIFGRNAPKRQQLTTGEEIRTKVIGEWPIIEMIRDEKSEKGQSGTHIVSAVHEADTTVFLDANYDGIVPDSWVFIDTSAIPPVDEKIFQGSRTDLLVMPSAKLVPARVLKVNAKISRSEYGISGDTVRLEVDAPWLEINVEVGDKVDNEESDLDIDRDFRVIRGTTVYARSEKLELALEPIEEDLCGASADDEPLELDGLYQDLEPGRFVVLSGERADLGGAVVRASEALMIRAVTHDVRAAEGPMPWRDALDLPRDAGEDPPKKLVDDKTHTFVWFDKPLSYCYRRNTVSIRANVVKATHGETRNETLGHGEGSKPLQTFGLKQNPLTHLAAATASGADSTLEVFVNDVRWHERESFVMTAPTARVYTTKADEQGGTRVTFGNGIEGARLPTGSENVKAVYRFGMGSAGNVRAEQITLLSSRPLGVREVINPLRASGGADRESRDQARRNAPNAVQALDRLVSTRDYADFARSFAGIGKATAVELPDGARTVVHVTIAGSDDIPIDRDSDLFINLRRALRALGDPFQPLELATRELLILVMSAKVRIDPDHRWEVVVKELRAKLLSVFGFENRDLGQHVFSSEVLAVMQAVSGVEFIDLDSFGAVPSVLTDASVEGGVRPLTPEEIAAQVQLIAAKSPPDARVVAALARPAAGGFAILPAQLAVLLPAAADTLVLNQIK